MTQISFYKNGTGEFIKQWPNWTGVVPAVGDMVVLHYGDDNEEERTYTVRLRVIDGTRPERIDLYIDGIQDEEQEEIVCNPFLDMTIDEFKDDLSVRAKCVCQHVGIRTLRDLTEMRKEDLLKNKNCGNKSVGELDNLLTKHGLTWAK
jgi:DNA-directed RNA polymerase alpha subunit